MEFTQVWDADRCICLGSLQSPYRAHGSEVRFGSRPETIEITRFGQPPERRLLREASYTTLRRGYILLGEIHPSDHSQQAFNHWLEVAYALNGTVENDIRTMSTRATMEVAHFPLDEQPVSGFASRDPIRAAQTTLSGLIPGFEPCGEPTTMLARIREHMEAYFPARDRTASGSPPQTVNSRSRTDLVVPAVAVQRVAPVLDEVQVTDISLIRRPARRAVNLEE